VAEPNETRVVYKAIADFVALRREVNRTKAAIASLKAQEAATNKASIKDSAAVSKAATARANAIKAQTVAMRAAVTQVNRYAKATATQTVATKASTTAIRAQNKALQDNIKNFAAASAAAKAFNNASGSSAGSATAAAPTAARSKRIRELKEEAAATDKVTTANVKFVDAVGDVDTATGEVVNSTKEHIASKNRLRDAIDRARASLRSWNADSTRTTSYQMRLRNSTEGLWTSFKKFGNWRPRLTPPFVALIPIIGAVVAAINPLVAIIGSLVPLTLGLASNIGSLAGAFLALPGILGGVVAGIAGVVASMGGVGSVFKTYSAMQKATGQGGGQRGESQAERAEKLADAEWNLQKAQRAVQKAQEGLNEARQEALRDLVDLRMEVSRASLTEERAIANLRQAQEDYWDTMADPGSTLGDKLDAAASIKEAEADLQDVRQQNIDNQKKLNDLEAKGVEGSDKVLDAQERLTDATIAQRDAQKALKTEVAGGNSAAATAINEYNEALAKLSPSARAVVLALIGLRDQWGEMRKDLQETFFSRIVGDMDKLPQIIKNIGNFLRPAVAAMGDLASAFIVMFASPEWTADLATIGEQNGSVVENLGTALLFLTTALKDIVIAAGPFTDWMTGGFAKGAKNFSDFIADARETGSLANWLEKVEGRLVKWWDILKNVGATLFNYSAAASEFGDWLSDGLLETTENWRKASEAAREEGSPFQIYLEDVKPLLSELKGLFGDFFGWLRDEMMDPDNIKDATDLVALLRDELGPAIGDFLDVLAETDIDEKFVHALSSIVDSLSVLMEKGGGAALETFFDVVVAFFDGIAGFISVLPPGALEGVLGFLGGLAGLTFVGKFTGATDLLGVMLGFSTAKTSGLAGMLSKLKGLTGLGTLGFAGLIGVLTLLLAMTPSVVESVTTGIDRKLGALNKEYPDTPKGDEDYKENALRNAGGSDMTAGIVGFFAGDEAKQAVLDWQADVNVAMGNFFGGILPALQNGWGQIATWFDTYVGQPLENGWNQITTFFTEGIPSFFAGIGPAMENGWRQISTWFDIEFGQPLENGWNQITTFFNTDVPNFFNGLGAKFANGWDQIVNGASVAWNAVQEAFRGPVNFVLETVYNNGLRSWWNGIASKLGLGGLMLPAAGLIGAPAKSGGGGGGVMQRSAYAEGGVLPGYTPGRDVHSFHSPTAGRLDLSGGEAIMRPEWTRAVGGKKAVDEMNSKARRGFASGGVIGNSNIRQADRKKSGIAKEVESNNTGGLLGQVGKFFADPIGFVKAGATNAISGLMGGIGGGAFGDILRSLPTNIISGLANTAKGQAAAAAPEGNYTGVGLGWQKMIEIVRQQFPGTRLNSGYRPGDSTMHGKGRAIDIPPDMAKFNWLRQNFPGSQALIYSPAGGRQLYQGKNHTWGEPYKSTHYNHVHWAMNQGGVLPPKLYDNGGWLPHGGMAVNQSGKPEAVLTPAESSALKGLLSGAGLAARPATSAAAAVTGARSAAGAVDASVNIGQLTIQNPRSERASTSLPKAIRQMGYMQNAREKV